MKAIHEFPDWFLKQKPNGKFVIGCAGIVLLACLWGGVLSIVARSSQSSKLPPTLTFQPGLSPTALFNFGVETFTPFPTIPAATALPTLTPPPTQTLAATQISTLTPAALPTQTNTPETNSGSLSIVSVNKASEYVDIQNGGTAAVNLNGWVLLSEKGHQACDLKGVLQPGEALRVFARTGDSGLSCGYPGNIWNDKEADAAVLYDPKGKEISRFP